MSEHAARTFAAPSAREDAVAADVAEDATVERVARAISDVDHAPEHGSSPPWDEIEPEFQDNYRRLARAAVAAMPPADEALRERVEALADRWQGQVDRYGSASCSVPVSERLRELRDALGGSR